MRDKGAVGADLYVEDSATNVVTLRDLGQAVIIMDNSTNRRISDKLGGRALDWGEAEEMIRDRYYSWLDEHGLDRPPKRGVEPNWAVGSPRPVVQDLVQA
jgi:hypothetical protein